jgi:hypothetical protein
MSSNIGNTYEREMMAQPLPEMPAEMCDPVIVRDTHPCADCPLLTGNRRVCAVTDRCHFAWLSQQAEAAGTPERRYVARPLTPLAV